jgi:hypothetical protein
MSGATLATWYVDDVEQVVDELGSRGVTFEHYEGLTTDVRGMSPRAGGGQRRPPRRSRALPRAHHLRLRSRPARNPAQRLSAGLPPRARRRVSLLGRRNRHHPAARGTQGPTAVRRRLVRRGSAPAAARLLRPDAILEIAAGPQRVLRTLLVEYDRTRRIDKNYDKLRRYDAFLCWWVRYTPYTNLPSLPYVLFVCQDETQREQFLAAADRELTGHRWHPTVPVDRHEYVGRRRILFAIERDAHAGDLEAWRLPTFPPDHPARDNNVRRVALTSGGAPARTDSQLRLPGEANVAPASVR